MAKGLDLSNEIDLGESFSKIEMFSPAQQIKRAADSVVLNIAEGSTGQTIPEYKRFLGLALRPAIELVSCLFIGRSRTYLSEEQFNKYYSEYEILCKMITSLRNSM